MPGPVNVTNPLFSVKPLCSSQCKSMHSALQSKVVSLETELTQLKDRYDALLRAKEAAAARYRTDYEKWKKFKLWLFTKSKDDRQARAVLSSPEKKRQSLKDIQKNLRKFQDSGPRFHDVDAEDNSLSGE